MKKKIFTLLTLLLCVCSGAWAEDITVTWLPNNMSSITKVGTASVDNILTVSDLTTSDDVQDPTISPYDSKSWGNFLCNTASDKNKYSKDDYITFAVTVATGYTFYPTSVTAYSVGAGTGEGGAKIFSTVQTENGTNAVTNSSNAATPTSLSLTTFSNSTFDGGSTLYFYIHIGSKNTSKGICIRDVVLTGTYEVAGMTKLTTPTISIVQASGEVTISDIDANATKVTYTTDGTDPTASSATYDNANKPVVDANCTIKAIAIGDGVSYSNSNIASLTANITVDDPIITAHNGTFAITCATDGATIKYNYDNSESWNTYTQPVTLFAGQTVYAKAESASYKNNSGTVSSAVEAAPAAAAGSKTKILSWILPANNNNWEYMEGDDGNSGTTNYGIRGKVDTNEEGWALWISPNGSGNYDKIIYGTSSYTIDETAYAYLRGSNGRQFNIDMPSNLRANRITLYSYNAADNGATIWNSVCGTTYTTDTEISIKTLNSTSPEIRVFALDDVANTITINNAGSQQLFIAVVDYTVYIPGPADAENITESTNVTETVTFTKSSKSTNSSVSPNSMASIITIASPNYKDSPLTGYNGALELGSSTTITIALPADATSASVTLVDAESTDKKLKVDGTDDSSRTWTGDAANGYSTTINIPDSKAGQNFVIAKKDPSTKIVKITLTYTAGVPTGDITLSTNTIMEGYRSFYDGTNHYEVAESDENTKIYVAAKKDETHVTMTEIPNIPAGTPVILKTTTGGTITLTKKATLVNPWSGSNLLQHSTAGQNFSAGDAYRLGAGGAIGVGFYEWITTSAEAGIVYLPASAFANESRSISMVFEDETTGIEAISNTQETAKGTREYYNLNGQRVANPTKGLYIVNGKKVIIK